MIEVPSGQTVADLMETIVRRIADQRLRSSFLVQCLAKGGRDIYRSELALQTYAGNASLNFLRAEDIPVPEVRSGDPIENIRFDVDLSDIACLSDQSCASVLAFEGGP